MVDKTSSTFGSNSQLNFSFFRNNIFFLIAIGTISFLIRMYYFPFEIPLTYDAYNPYFLYAAEINYINGLPNSWSPSNNGWPSFAAFFFSILPLENVFSYMQVQRLLSIILSVLTIIPIYFLGKLFLEKKYALIGVTFFAFEPRIIQNSLLGIAEPLFIILETLALFFFLNSNKKLITISFVLAALASIVRAEGLFIFLAFSIIFFIRFKKERKRLIEYLFFAAIFILILTPVALYRIEINGNDGLLTRIEAGVEYEIQSFSNLNDPNKIDHLKNTLEMFFKFLGWVMIPSFILFVPLGIFLIFKNRNFKIDIIIIFSIILSIPALYAYSIPAPDTRYLYILFPMFCIFSIFAVKKYFEKMQRPNSVLVLIIAGLVISSVVYLEYKKIDYEHEKESFELGQQVSAIASGVNEYKPESWYTSTCFNYKIL